METATTTLTVPAYATLSSFSETFQGSISMLKASGSGIMRRGGVANASLFSLPDDILLHIITHVEVEDILSIRRTSKRLFAVSKLRWVWSDAMRRHVIDKGLPIPKNVTDIKSLSSEDLEARVVHATQLHENWNSSKPKARPSIDFQVHITQEDVSEMERPSVQQLFFLPGHNGELLVTLAGRTITCWEVPLNGSGAYVVAEWVHDTAIQQIIVNEEASKNAAVLAFTSLTDPQTRVIDIITLGLDTFHGCFERRSILRGFHSTIAPMHAMVGDAVILGDPLWIWYTSDPVTCITLPMAPPSASAESNAILTVKVIDRYICIVREHCIQLVFFPQVGSKRECPTRIATIQFQQHASEAVVFARPQTTPAGGQPVTVLLRCWDQGSDAVREFNFLVGQNRKGAPKVVDPQDGDPEVWRALYISPISSSTAGVAPSACQFVAGASGKCLWVETRNVTSCHSTFPARCLVGFQLNRSTDVSVSTKDGLDSKAKAHTSSNVLGAPVGILQLPKTSLYARRCDMSEILHKKYCMTRVALEDTVGRIAIGDRQGRVEVLDFA